MSASFSPFLRAMFVIAPVLIHNRPLNVNILTLALHNALFASLSLDLICNGFLYAPHDLLFAILVSPINGPAQGARKKVKCLVSMLLQRYRQIMYSWCESIALEPFGIGCSRHS